MLRGRKISAISFVIAFNIKHAFSCSQNSAISFVIAPPGKKTGAIMKLISGRQIGQKWSYNNNSILLHNLKKLWPLIVGRVCVFVEVS